MALPQITWRDLQQAPDDGKRREAIGGELYVTPAPSVRHQRVSQRLELQLIRLLQEPGLGEVFHAPIGVEFPATGEGVQPDILFVSEEREDVVATDWLRGAPDLIIEILSPATEERDRGIKRELYQRQGVRQYWVVDPRDDAVEVWRFGDETTHARFTSSLPVRLGGEALGQLDLDDVFARGT